MTDINEKMTDINITDINITNKKLEKVNELIDIHQDLKKKLNTFIPKKKRQFPLALA